MAKNTFHLDVITPECVKFQGEVVLLIAPTAEGEISVLAHHAPLMSLLMPGELVLKSEHQQIYLAIGSGFLKISENKAVALVDFAEKPEEIDLYKTEKTKRDIEDQLSSKKFTDIDFEKLRIQLQVELVRLKVASKKK